MSSPSEQQTGNDAATLHQDLIRYSTLGDEEKLQSVLRAKANPNIQDSEGLSPILWAAKRGHKNAIKILLDWKARPTAADRNGRSVLHAAVLSMKDSSHCLRVLLSHGADPNVTDNDSRTALISAARRGKFGCIKMLILAKIDVNHHDRQKRTALFWAARNGRVKCVRILLHYFAKVDKADQGKKTALIAAAYHGRSTCLQQLILARASINSRDKLGRTALIGAAVHGHMQCVHRLINARADANIIDSQGNTALHYALSRGFSEITQILDGNGASLDGARLSSPRARTARALSEGSVPNSIPKRNPYALLLACHQGDYLTVQQLLDVRRLHPQRFAAKDGKQVTALHVASSNGYTQIAAALLKAGFSPTSQDKAGLTPLHLAAKCGSEKTVQLILDHFQSEGKRSGCDVESGIGSTPLHYASQFGWASIVHILLKSKANLHQQNSYGWQPIHYAASYGSPQVLQILVQKRANIEARTRNRGPQDTPLICAARHSRFRCAEILLEARADLHKQNADGNSALVHAAFCGATQCLGLLIAHKADLNMPDADSSTALMQAVLCGKSDAARILVASKADLDVADKDKNTALIYAAQQGSFTKNSNVITMLVAAGSSTEKVNSAGRKAWDYGSMPQTQAAIENGLREREVMKRSLPRIAKALGDVLNDCGIPFPMHSIIVNYWDVFWHYFTGFEFRVGFNQ